MELKKTSEVQTLASDRLEGSLVEKGLGILVDHKPAECPWDRGAEWFPGLH